jgi:desulfoferrodoxin-like iron-binding protein
VRLGRVYHCLVCGAEVMVIKAASQALDPHCCNAAMQPLERVSAIYHCKVCGSEVAVLRGGGERLELVCCHQPMSLREAAIPEAA